MPPHQPTRKKPLLPPMYFLLLLYLAEWPGSEFYAERINVQWNYRRIVKAKGKGAGRAYCHGKMPSYAYTAYYRWRCQFIAAARWLLRLFPFGGE